MERYFLMRMVSTRTRSLAGRCIFAAAMLSFFSVVDGASARNLTLRVGDRFLIQDTPLDCRIDQVSSGIEVSCAYDNLSNTTPRPTSYGVVMTDRFAAIARYRSATSARIVVYRTEPTTHRGPFPSPKRRPMAFTLRAGQSAPIGGTDFACGVAREGRRTGIECLPVGPHGSAVPDAWGALQIGTVASLLHYRGRSAVVDARIVKIQP